MQDAGHTFGALVRTLRRHAGIGMGELADAADISATYIGSIERDVKTPSIEVVWEIAKAVGASARTCGELFEAAGYGDFWKALVDTAAVERTGVPTIDVFVNNTPELRTKQARDAARVTLHALSEGSFTDEEREAEREAEPRSRA